MSTKRQLLLNRMIHLYGENNPIVIEFLKLCNDYPASEWNDQCLLILVEAHEAELK